MGLRSFAPEVGTNCSSPDFVHVPPPFFLEKPIPCHVPRMAASLSTWVGGPDASQGSPLEEPPSPDSTSSSLPPAQNFAIAHFYTWTFIAPLDFEPFQRVNLTSANSQTLKLLTFNKSQWNKGANEFKWKASDHLWARLPHRKPGTWLRCQQSRRPQKLEKYFERFYFMTLLKSTMGEISVLLDFLTLVLQFRIAFILFWIT